MRAGAVDPEHDFGPILAGDKILRHEFILKNPTDRAIRLLGAEARTPCCSSIGPLPKEIPSGGAVKVPVAYKTGYVTGPRRVEFVIATDFSPNRIWPLAVRAQFFAEYEVEREGDFVLIAGKEGHQVLHVICRRRGKDGRGAPVGLDVHLPLEAALSGPVIEHEEDGIEGLIRSARDVSVRLPALTQPGPHRSDLLLRWDGERTEPCLVSWTVVPPIKANPTGFVLKESEGSTRRIVTLSASDQPFRTN